MSDSMTRRVARWFHRRTDSPHPPRDEPDAAHLATGRLGEEIALRYLENHGLRLLNRNFQGRHGEIDLVLRDQVTLVFTEVKTRGPRTWIRPAAAVNRAKQRRLSRTALEYLRAVGNPVVPFRFDIVEVLVDGDQVREIRHLPDAFGLCSPYRYG